MAWFFAAIHEVPRWARFVRRLLDTEKVVTYPFRFQGSPRPHQLLVPGHMELCSSAERSELDHALGE